MVNFVERLGASEFPIAVRTFLNGKNERLRLAMIVWRERSRRMRVLLSGTSDVPVEVEPWKEALEDLGYENKPDWIFTLLASPEKMDDLESFLAECDAESESLVKERIQRSVLSGIDFFSRGAAPDPAKAREDFLALAPRLRALYALVGGEDLASQCQFAVDRFDVQVVARRSTLEARLNWKPQEPQTRVSRQVDHETYEPGQPHWWTGKLNDAPEMLGQKLERERAEQMAVAMERSLLRYFGGEDVPRPLWPEIHLQNTFFSQGREPRVQFGEMKDSPGVEGYLKKAPEGGPRVLEFPLEDGTFAYLMFDGHHRAAAQIIQGRERFVAATVMRLGDVEKRFGLSEQDIVDAIRDLHTHLYMTDAPVPR